MVTIMANLKVNVDAVVASANNIKQCNNQMRDNFPSVQSAITRLDNNWEGSAATATISKFNEIKSKFSDSRYNVMDNYVNFLLQQVGEGYTQTESVNKSLADQFK